VEALRGLLLAEHVGRALGALGALEELEKDDSRMVSKAAAEALAQAPRELKQSAGTLIGETTVVTEEEARKRVEEEARKRDEEEARKRDEEEARKREEEEARKREEHASDQYGWTSHSSAKMSLSLALPPDWQYDEKEDKLAGASPDSKVSLSIRRSVPVPLDEFVPVIIAELQSRLVPGGEVETERVRLNAGQAAKLTYQHKAGARVTMFLLSGEQGSYTIAFGSQPGHDGMIDRIAATLRFLPAEQEAKEGAEQEAEKAATAREEQERMTPEKAAEEFGKAADKADELSQQGRVTEALELWEELVVRLRSAAATYPQGGAFLGVTLTAKAVILVVLQWYEDAIQASDEALAELGNKEETITQRRGAFVAKALALEGLGRQQEADNLLREAPPKVEVAEAPLQQQVADLRKEIAKVRRKGRWNRFLYGENGKP
jgi:tetratricopeptide (TPR) repeat protein